LLATTYIDALSFSSGSSALADLTHPTIIQAADMLGDACPMDIDSFSPQ